MSKQDNTYGGWANYETWRINLELFDNQEAITAIQPYTAETCEDYVVGLLDEEEPTNQTLVFMYACAFINPVNWHEIAEHLNERRNKQ
jgi:hypothetical protein